VAARVIECPASSCNNYYLLLITFNVTLADIEWPRKWFFTHPLWQKVCGKHLYRLHILFPLISLVVVYTAYYTLQIVQLTLHHKTSHKWWDERWVGFNVQPNTLEVTSGMILRVRWPNQQCQALKDNSWSVHQVNPTRPSPLQDNVK